MDVPFSDRKVPIVPYARTIILSIIFGITIRRLYGGLTQTNVDITESKAKRIFMELG